MNPEMIYFLNEKQFSKFKSNSESQISICDLGKDTIVFSCMIGQKVTMVDISTEKLTNRGFHVFF